MGVEDETFKDTCLHVDLLQDASEWDSDFCFAHDGHGHQTMNDAVLRIDFIIYIMMLLHVFPTS